MGPWYISKSWRASTLRRCRCVLLFNVWVTPIPRDINVFLWGSQSDHKREQSSADTMIISIFGGFAVVHWPFASLNYTTNIGITVSTRGVDQQLANSGVGNNERTLRKKMLCLPTTNPPHRPPTVLSPPHLQGLAESKQKWEQWGCVLGVCRFL